MAVSGGFVAAVGEPGREPEAERAIVAGRSLVTGGRLTATGVDEMLARHRRIAGEWLEASAGG